MTGDNCRLLSKETRLALCDMTNVPSKRGISSFLGDLLLKSGDDSGKAVAPEGSGVKFSKRLCLVVDDLVKESIKTSDTNEGSSSDDKNSSGNSPVDGDSGNFNLADLKESQGETNVADMSGEPSKGDDSDAIPSGDCNLLKEVCEKDSDIIVCGSQTDAVTSEDILAMPVLSSCNSESRTDMLLNSQTMKSFNINRCSTVDSTQIVNHHMEADDELKSCSCSFCLKAAYIWSDLHYQDIKGRLSVLKKSQKEASSLIQRNGKGKPTDIYNSENSNNSTISEPDVMAQWTSLFLNMESILARESNHLQDSLVAMKEMRENCKIDLERATKTPQQNNT